MRHMYLGELSAVDLTKRVIGHNRQIDTAGFRLASYISWPENEARRSQYLAAIVADDFDVIGDAALISNPNDHETAARAKKALQDSVADEFIEPAGGYSGLANTPSMKGLNEEKEKAYEKADIAGQILYLCAALHNQGLDREGGSSKEKAIFLIQKKGSRTISSARGFNDCWSRFKSVAPIMAALRHLESSRNLRNWNASYTPAEFMVRGLGYCLSAAQSFARFATEFRPHARTEPLIAESEIWQTPLGLTLPRLRINLPAISDQDLGTLREYKPRTAN